MTVGKHGRKVSQSYSGSLDLKVVLSHSKTTAHSLHVQIHAYTGMSRRMHGEYTLKFSAHVVFFSPSWPCFSSRTLNGHFYLSRHEQWSEKPDKQAGNTVFPSHRQRHWCPLQPSQTLGLSVSIGILGHSNVGLLIFKEWRKTGHMDSIRVFFFFFATGDSTGPAASPPTMAKAGHLMIWSVCVRLWKETFS